MGFLINIDMNTDFTYFVNKDLKKDIGTISHDTVIAYWSEGRWSVHELLEYLLSLTGPAKVTLSTFSISEASIRAFNKGIDSGTITELNCLFDYTIKKNKVQLLYFANSVANKIRLAPNHSKIILIENKDWKLAVVGSANMTPNPRKEAGAIITVPAIYDQYYFHLTNAIDNGLEFSFDV